MGASRANRLRVVAAVLCVVVLAGCSGCSAGDATSAASVTSSPGVEYYSSVCSEYLLAPSDVDPAVSDDATAVTHPGSLPGPRTRCRNLDRTLVNRDSMGAGASVFWYRSTDDGQPQGDAVLELVAQWLSIEDNADRVNDCVELGFGFLVKSGDVVVEEELVYLLAPVEDGVFGWISVIYDYDDGYDTVRYMLARVELADGQKAEMLVAHYTPGQPSDPENMPDLLHAALDKAGATVDVEPVQNIPSPTAIGTPPS